MFWLVVLGFVLGALIFIPLTSIFWAFAFSLKALSGYTFKRVGKIAKWVENE